MKINSNFLLINESSFSRTAHQLLKRQYLLLLDLLDQLEYTSNFVVNWIVKPCQILECLMLWIMVNLSIHENSFSISVHGNLL